MKERLELYDELKERNHTARSARVRPGGKKKYLLPSDKLSNSELKKMNGEIVVYTMKEPISWQKFKGYPVDIQKEYLQWFADEFGVSPGLMGDVFGISANYCTKLLREMGLRNVLCEMPLGGAREKLAEWLKQYRPESEVEEKPPVEEPKKKEPKPVEQPMFFNTITGCEMSMEGKASEIGQMLYNLFRDQTIAVNISFVGIKESEAESAEVV